MYTLHTSKEKCIVLGSLEIINIYPLKKKKKKKDPKNLPKKS